MASAGGIRAGRAYVELYGEDSQLMRTLDRSAKRLETWGKGITDIGAKTMMAAAAIGGGMLSAVSVWSDMGHEIQSVSKSSGVTAESISTLGFAARQTGGDMDALEHGFKKVSEHYTAAVRGNKEAIEGFQRLGLTFSDLQGQTPDQMLRIVGDRLSRIKDPALRAATATELLGKRGEALLPMFADGAKGLAALEQQARDLGLELSGADVKAADQFSKQMMALWDVMKRGVFAVGSALGPALTDLVMLVTSYSVRAAKWIDANSGLIVTGAKVVAIVLAAGAAMFAAGTAMSLLGSGITMGITVFKTIAVGVAMLGQVLGFLVTPIGLVVAGIGLATAAFLYFSGYGSAAIQWLQERIGELRQIFGEAWGGIVAAVMKGDLGAAAEIAWLTVQVAFFSATAEIWAAWTKFCSAFMGLWDTVTFNLARLFADPWNTIQVWWATGVDAMLNVWLTLMNGIMNAFASAKGFLQKGIAGLLNLLSGENITLGFDEIDKGTAAEQLANNKAIAQNKAEIARDTNNTLKQLDKERNDAAKDLDEQLEQKRTDREKDLQKSLDGSKDKLGKLRDQWANSIKEAETTVDKTNKKPGATGPTGPNLDGLQEARHITNAGTFNAAAVRGFGGGQVTAVERIAKATERTAKATETIAEKKNETPNRPKSANSGPKFSPSN